MPRKKNRGRSAKKSATAAKPNIASVIRTKLRQAKEKVSATKKELAALNRTWRAKFKTMKAEFTRQLKAAKSAGIEEALADFVRAEKLKAGARLKAVEAALIQFDSAKGKGRKKKTRGRKASTKPKTAAKKTGKRAGRKAAVKAEKVVTLKKTRGRKATTKAKTEEMTGGEKKRLGRPSAKAKVAVSE